MEEKYKTNPWVHTLYISSILLIILTFVIILMSKESISEAAIANVSFAATIVSIVLAVISIVISVVASFRTYQNLGGMNDIEIRLNEAIARLKQIDGKMDSTDNKVKTLQELLRPTSQEQLKEEAVKTISEMREASPQSNTILTPKDIIKLEKKVVERITQEEHLTNLMIDYHFPEYPLQNFDGVARKGAINYLIEVKLFRPNLIEHLIKRMIMAKRQVSLTTSHPTEVIVGFLLPNDSDKDTISATFTPRFEENGISVRFFHFKDINNSPTHCS